jgi:hypothetical protein
MANRYRIVRRVDRPWWFWGIVLATGAAIVALWPGQAQSPGYRAMCEAQGGIVVHLEDSGRLCLWAGAVIPVKP